MVLGVPVAEKHAASYIVMALPPSKAGAENATETDVGVPGVIVTVMLLGTSGVVKGTAGSDGGDAMLEPALFDAVTVQV
jgi:hypothetical protein